MDLEQIINAAVESRLSEVCDRYLNNLDTEVRKRLEKFVEQELQKHELKIKEHAIHIVEKRLGSFDNLGLSGSISFRLESPDKPKQA